MQVLVVGAGIGRLTTGVALGTSGVDFHVYEPADVLRTRGAPYVGDIWSSRMGHL